MPYYLASYIGRGTRLDSFRPSITDPGWSAIDLRPDGGATLGGGGLNACLLHLPAASSDLSLTQIGLDPADLVRQPTVTAINSRLGTSVVPGRLDQLVASILITPPVNGWKPILAGVDHPREVWLGGLFWREVITGGSDPAWLRLRHRRRLTPTQQYLYDLWSHSGATPWVAFRLARHGRWPIAGGVLPATDNFNRANEDPLTNAGKWTQTVTTAGSNLAVVANQCTGGGTTADDAPFWWNADSFTDNHYSQVKVVTFGGSEAGPTVRHQSGVYNTYSWIHAGANNNRIVKIALSGYTTLQQSNAAFIAGDTAKLDISGSTLRIYRNGVQANSVTDATYSLGASGLLGVGQDTTLKLDDWQGDNVALSKGPGTYVLYLGR